MFGAALFMIAPNWKQPRCPSVVEWMARPWCVYIWECPAHSPLANLKALQEEREKKKAELKTAVVLKLCLLQHTRRAKG